MFGAAGIEYRYIAYHLTATIERKEKIERYIRISMPSNNPRAEIERALETARSIIELEESLPELKGRIVFRARDEGAALILKDFYVVVVFSLDESDVYLPLANRYFEGFLGIEKRLREKYGDEFQPFYGAGSKL